ncbi:hypothetical protein CEH05_07685 [Halobacillus halophilus]|uniref:YetF C-terminal domain-containing protein n=1 Tax=Halobacillus halophilus (strain ATCC 35676 / DSM 2266 / JCM 20832 / KCTC 3685 / LMG 17431 / NBRC 102448 / NCIMB 2269) TaxID=866895 RepID=I0JL56_HALH3|nr:DUF421 domain-containing protein [Halobacillus halophilus]ASF38998.1 hypothetical protein CEH05_07685 [Halobacillus halophilus]CCG44876.1 hypothetical protein HBHAL_2531 [Halobacillus halophilus DSM 2266]
MTDGFEVLYRGTLFLIVLFFLTKLLGKKQISQLTFFEYVTGITIGSIAAEVIMGLENNIWHGILGTSIFAVLPFLIGLFSLHSKKVRDFVDGTSTVLIKDGKVLEGNLKKEKYTLDELLQLLRGKNIFELAEVEYAVLEADGKLSVLPKKDYRQVTRKDLGLESINEKEPHMVIMAGKIMDKPLLEIGKDEDWLNTELEKRGTTLDKVFIGQVDSYGSLTIDLYNDEIQDSTPQDRPLLLANIKKCQADLELFALATDSPSAKALYEKNAEKLASSMEKLTPYLKC